MLVLAAPARAVRQLSYGEWQSPPSGPKTEAGGQAWVSAFWKKKPFMQDTLLCFFTAFPHLSLDSIYNLFSRAEPRAEMIWNVLFRQKKIKKNVPFTCQV